MNVHKVTKPAPPPIHAAETRGGGWRGWTTVALISFLIATIIAVCDRRGLFANQDRQGYDLLVKSQKAKPSSDAVFVDFDEPTVRSRNAFPIPRNLLREVIEKVSEGGPSVVGLDVILDQPRDKRDDDNLAIEIEKAGNVILASEYGYSDHPRSEPLQVFVGAASGIAFADLLPDPDGSVRRMLLRVTTKEYKRTSFPLALADLFSNRHLSPGHRGYVMFGKTEVPLATAAPNPDTVLIHFRPSLPAPRVSVNDLLANKIDVSIFAGKIVVIGQSSEEGKDFFKTPVSNTLPTIEKRPQLTGTEIHAAAADTLLNDEAIQMMHGGAPRWILGLVLGFLVAACGYRQRWFISVGACALLVAAVFGVSLYLFSNKHLWMPFVSTDICLVLALPAGLGYRSVEERHLKRMMEAERGQIMGLFERYVSPDVAAEIWKRRDQIVLGGEERVATIFFSDIRSFTAMTCGVPSHEVLAWLNRYLTAMGEVIKKNRGFLNKFIGDGIMVVFGAPLSEGPKDDACRAVRCALEMLVRLDEWNANLKPGEHPLNIGIGIHTGPVTAGNVGSPDRLEYSVIGEAVNLASRLEALTKEFKTPIVISPATWEYIRGVFPTVSLGEKEVRGFTTAIPLYSVETHSPVEVHS